MAQVSINTVPVIITYTKTAQYLASLDLDIGNKNNPSLSPMLPIILEIENGILSWLYGIDNTNSNLTKVANYVWGLTGSYGITAEGIVSGVGSSVTFIPNILNSPIQFVVGSGALYVPNNGDSSYNNPTLAGKNNYSIYRQIIADYLFAGIDFTYLTTGGFTLLSSTFIYGERFTLTFY